jgi:hypothetical protein
MKQALFEGQWLRGARMEGLWGRLLKRHVIYMNENSTVKYQKLFKMSGGAG